MGDKSKDTSMNGRTPQWIDDRAKDDARNGDYDPPYSWTPFTRDAEGTEARDRYDRAYEYHRGDKDEKDE